MLISNIVWALFVCAGLVWFFMRERNRTKKIDSAPPSGTGRKNVNNDTPQYKAEDKNINSEPSPGDNKEARDSKVQDLILRTLNNLNCQPKVENDNKFYFKYQGENFLIIQHQCFIRIWDLPFSNVNVLDTNLYLFIEAINSTNYNMGPTIVLSDPDKEGKRYLQSRMDLLFTTEIRNPELYLSTILDMFFDLKNQFQREVYKITNPSEQDEKTYVPSHPSQN